MYYSIGEISNLMGIAISTMRYYDREGMFQTIDFVAISESDGNHQSQMQALRHGIKDREQKNASKYA